MCGIAGFFHYRSDTIGDISLLNKMGDAMKHRGPDEDGVFLDKTQKIGFAHRRLSIIDLSTGQQPMANDDQSIWLIFNGEIYNFPEYRQDLEKRGCRFKTRSDTEVILRGYEADGEKSFSKLNGIFAFVIADLKQRKLFLVRDPFGVKPLYYHDGEGTLSFGSEIKALLQNPRISVNLDPAALRTFLTYRYNPSPETLLDGIKKLAPGTYMSVADGGKTKIVNYVPERGPVRTNIDDEEAVVEYQRILEASVRRQMLSDVPVGLFLSGGVDSAVIGHLMQKNSSRKIQTFTIGFEGKGDYNELGDARETAQLLGTDHHELTIGAKEYLDFFCRSFQVIEEPIAETTVSALYYVSQLAAKNVKVVLAGQGADEPMAGYPRYMGAQFMDQHGLGMKPFAGLAAFLPRNERLKRAAYALGATTELSRIHRIYTIFTQAQADAMLNSAARRIPSNLIPSRLRELFQKCPAGASLLDKLMYIDSRMSLPDDLLLFNDKTTMANSLEMRVPFLDHELMMFIESLPSKMKLRGGVGKFIHKKAAERWLPKAIVHRKKRGFATPMDEWLQTGLADRAGRLFMEKNSACSKYFNPTAIKKIVQAHKSRRQNFERQIYALLSFELWHRAWIDKSPILILP